MLGQAARAPDALLGLASGVGSEQKVAGYLRVPSIVQAVKFEPAEAENFSRLARIGST